MYNTWGNEQHYVTTHLENHLFGQTFGPESLDLILMPLPTISRTFSLASGLLNLSSPTFKLGTMVYLPCNLSVRTKRESVFRMI